MNSSRQTTSNNKSNGVDSLTSSERTRIDLSTSAPVTLFIGSSIFWILAASFLAFISSSQLIFPSLLDFCGMLTYGRLYPAAMSLMAYGWATPAAIGIGLWLISRTSQIPLLHTTILTSAGIIWNLGVLIGTCGILIGDGQPFELLAFPSYATVILFVAFAMIAVWVLFTAWYARNNKFSLAQCFVILAFVSFPWLFCSANLVLLWHPIQASAQGVVAAWYFGGFNNLWLGAMAIGAMFYLIPKAVDRPIYSETLGQLSFWTFLLFAAWTGMARYIGGPFPAWLVSAGVVASVLALIPTFSIAINIHMTLHGQYGVAGWCPTVRFLAVALFSLVFAAVFAAINALPDVSAVTNFSQVPKAQQILGFYGFFSMVAFGAIYYILPRTYNWEWPCSSLIHWHFWLALAGIILGTVSAFLGGFLQGFALFDIANTFRSSLEFVTPFLFLSMLYSFLILASNVAFASQFVLMLLKSGKPKTGPTFLAEPIETSHEPAAV